MKRPLIFTQSLLVLVVAIHVISACKCGIKSTMEKAICKKLTLMMGTPRSAELVDSEGHPVTNSKDASMTKYNMYLNTMYHEGPKRMGDHHDFVLLTATTKEKCGVQLEIDTEYYISGEALNRTHLRVNSCNYVESVPWHKSAAELEIINDYLTGHTGVYCRKPPCRIVTYTGAIIPCNKYL